MDDSTGGNHFIRMQGTWWKGFFVSHQFKGAGAFGGVFCGRMWGKSEVRFGITVVSYMDDQVGEHFFVHTSEIPPKTNIDIQNDGFWKKPGLDKDLSCCTAKKQLLCWRTFCNKQDPMVDSVDLKYNKNRVDHMHIPYFDMVQPEPLVVKRNLSNSRRSQWHGFLDSGFQDSSRVVPSAAGWGRATFHNKKMGRWWFLRFLWPSNSHLTASKMPPPHPQSTFQTFQPKEDPGEVDQKQIRF